MKHFLITCVLVLVSTYSYAKEEPAPIFRNHELNHLDDYGEPLFLTPFIDSNEIEQARHLSQVRNLPDAPDLLSYSGYFTVNRRYNSNMFFWFFPAMNGDKNAPLIMWLQGGPGASSMFGLFVEHGPFVIDANVTAKIRPDHWAQKFQVLYVDNPVGTGFSFTESDEGYVRNQKAVGRDLYRMLQQFFTVFAEYRKNDFYIAGQSYAGKYVPAIAFKIHTEGETSNINLKGIIIGNGLFDPEMLMNYHDYFYQLGLIDRKQYAVMKTMAMSIHKHVRQREFYEAVMELNKMVIDFDEIGGSYFGNVTGYLFYNNHLFTKEPEENGYYKNYLNLPKLKKSIHVGRLAFNNGTIVLEHLLLDIMKSVKPLMPVLMENYRVLMYNGQLDLIIPYSRTVNFLHSIKWKYAAEYKNAERQIWKLNGTDEIAGYVHNVEDFYEVLVRNAGHAVPYGQPKYALDLITRFIYRQPYS